MLGAHHRRDDRAASSRRRSTLLGDARAAAAAAAHRCRCTRSASTAACCAAASASASSYMDGAVGLRRPRRADADRCAERRASLDRLRRVLAPVLAPSQRGVRCWRATPRALAQAHRCALRPRQRAVRDVPGPHDDVLVRGVRRAAMRRSSRPRSQSSSASARSSSSAPGDHVLEIGTGWGGFAVYAAAALRLPRDDHDDLARAARIRQRAGARGGARGPGHGAARGLPRPARQLRQARARSR